MEVQPHAVPAVSVEPQPSEPKEESSGVFKEKTFLPEESTREPPLSIYEKIKGEPFTVKYFGLHDWLAIVRTSDFDKSGLKTKVATLENFIGNEVQRRGLEDSIKSFASIIQDLKVRLEIDPLEKGNITFEKILSLIKLIRGVSAYEK